MHTLGKFTCKFGFHKIIQFGVKHKNKDPLGNAWNYRYACLNVWAHVICPPGFVPTPDQECEYRPNRDICQTAAFSLFTDQGTVGPIESPMVGLIGSTGELTVSFDPEAVFRPGTANRTDASPSCGALPSCLKKCSASYNVGVSGSILSLSPPSLNIDGCQCIKGTLQISGKSAKGNFASTTFHLNFSCSGVFQVVVHTPNFSEGDAPCTMTYSADGARCLKLHQGVNMRLVPVAGTIPIPRMAESSRFKTTLTNTGKFAVFISEDNHSAGCSLPSTLTIKCKQGMDLKGTRCVPETIADPAYLAKGITIGTVLALCIIMLLYPPPAHPPPADPAICNDSNVPWHNSIPPSPCPTPTPLSLILISFNDERPPLQTIICSLPTMTSVGDEVGSSPRWCCTSYPPPSPLPLSKSSIH